MPHSTEHQSNEAWDRSVLGRGVGSKIDKYVFDVAVAPALGGMVAFDDRMAGRMNRFDSCQMGAGFRN